MVNVQTLHRRAARVLPEVIKTSGVFLGDSGENSLTALLFPLRRKSNGALVFRMSPAMLEAMETEPLAYLKEATRAREGLGRLEHPFVYGEWRVANIPASWMAMALGFRAERSDSPLRTYFTVKTDGKAIVVVIPQARAVVYVWRD
ncbi:MAG: hypothetical protein ABWY94_09220 [Pseudoxanthomonas sp.]